MAVNSFDARLDEGLREDLVRALVEFRDGGDRLEGLLVDALVAVQPRRDVFQADSWNSTS